MDEEKRIYSKVSLERELLPQQKNGAFGVEVPIVSIPDIKQSAYQKPEIEEMPKSFFVPSTRDQVGRYVKKIISGYFQSRINLEESS